MTEHWLSSILKGFARQTCFIGSNTYKEKSALRIEKKRIRRASLFLLHYFMRNITVPVGRWMSPQ